MCTSHHGTDDHAFVAISHGRRIRIRALQQNEDAPIRELWPFLSPRTRYLRFLTVMNTLPEPLVRRLTAVDGRRTLGFVAEHDAGDRPVVIGMANLGAVDGSNMEVGLVVRDDWQRQHVGTELAKTMMLAAEQRGFRRFIGYIYEENVAMRTLLRTLAIVVSSKVSGSVHELAFVRRQP